jgi:glutathione S-transferase
MADLEILGAPQSNYVWVCRIACEEKGVPYKLVPVRPHSPEIDAIHPFGKIPAMRHGEVKLFESKAICTYIDRAFPGPALVPMEPVGHALCEQWISTVNTTIDIAMLRTYGVAYFFPGTSDGKPDRAVVDAAAAKLAKPFDVLEAALAGTGHLVGASFTLADANLVPILYYMSRLPESGKLLKERAKVASFLERMLARGSVKATIPPPMPGR